jgi:CO/xanthine dehydrogenase FAD-binding subunit
MIIEYHRPENLQAALDLLARQEIKTVPMGGGSVLNSPSTEAIAAVDLQFLGLNTIEQRGNNLFVGATATLQSSLDDPAMLPALGDVIRHEATYNLRQIATIAGALLAADGRSPLAAALMALDAKATILPGEEQWGVGDLLLQRGERLRGRLVTQINLPTNVRLSYQYAARTPADLPIVCVVAASWPSGRLRLVLGGYGKAPLLALDGPESSGAAEAAENAYYNAGDEWASAEYRREVAGTLTKRCLDDLNLMDLMTG